MFKSNSAFDEPEYELPKVEAVKDKPEEDKSLREAAWHDLNELAEDIRAADSLNEEETRLLQERVENIRDTLYSTFN